MARPRSRVHAEGIRDLTFKIDIACSLSGRPVDCITAEMWGWCGMYVVGRTYHTDGGIIWDQLVEPLLITTDQAHITFLSRDPEVYLGGWLRNRHERWHNVQHLLRLSPLALIPDHQPTSSPEPQTVSNIPSAEHLRRFSR